MAQVRNFRIIVQLYRATLFYLEIGVIHFPTHQSVSSGFLFILLAEIVLNKRWSKIWSSILKSKNPKIEKRTIFLARTADTLTQRCCYSIPFAVQQIADLRKEEKFLIRRNEINSLGLD